jgi:predicted DNA-binding ArsR family transcriptional regulator
MSAPFQDTVAQQTNDDGDRLLGEKKNIGSIKEAWRIGEEGNKSSRHRGAVPPSRVVRQGLWL